MRYRGALTALCGACVWMLGCGAADPQARADGPVGAEDGGPGEDAAPADAAPPAPQVGSGCWVDADCPSGASCWTAEDGFPGGYCMLDGCTAGSCPTGSDCFDFTDGSKRCLQTCGSSEECRADEGYACDTGGTCWPGDNLVPPGGSCADDAQCMGDGNGYCATGNGRVGGYCIVYQCTADSCPAGSKCVAEVFTDGAAGCLPGCAADADCREGYRCSDTPDSSYAGTCRPGCGADADCPGDYVCRDNEYGTQVCLLAPPWCSAEHPQGDCDAGQLCEAGACAAFTCAADALEANNSQSAAPALPAGDTPGLTICAGDEDWFSFAPTQANTYYFIAKEAPYTTGDADLTLVDQGGTVVDETAMYREDFNDGSPVGTANVEATGILGAPGSPSYFARVFGTSLIAATRYTLVARQIDFKDGPSCEALYAKAECRAQTAGGAHDASLLLPFPAWNPLDTFAATDVHSAGTSATVPERNRSSQRWARRELIMIVRQAIHAVQEHFPGTTPLGIGEVGLYDGSTPWGHPNYTHYHGANVDLAYYVQPTKQHGWGNLVYRSICCDAAMIDRMVCVNQTTGTCNAGAETTHIVDLPRTALFLAKLAASGRLRVVGVEAKIKAGLVTELNNLKTAGVLTQAEVDGALNRMATADDDGSWVWHFHHMHASFCDKDC